MVRLVGGGLVLDVALSLVGWAIVKLATLRGPHPDPRHTVSHIRRYLAGTVTCIVLLVVTVALRLWLGRWLESWTLPTTLVGELLVVTAVVNRPRPGVPHLDAAAPTSSFPSGHTAPAVAFYDCLAVIVRLRRRRVRVGRRLDAGVARGALAQRRRGRAPLRRCLVRDVRLGVVSRWRSRRACAGSRSQVAGQLRDDGSRQHVP